MKKRILTPKQEYDLRKFAKEMAKEALNEDYLAYDETYGY